MHLSINLRFELHRIIITDPSAGELNPDGLSHQLPTLASSGNLLVEGARWPRSSRHNYDHPCLTSPPHT